MAVYVRVCVCVSMSVCVTVCEGEGIESECTYLYRKGNLKRSRTDANFSFIAPSSEEL